MSALADLLERTRRERKTLDVYAESETTAAAIREQFASRNVRVVRTAYAADDGGEFVVVRDADGAYLGAIGVEQFRRLLAPDVRAPWELAGTGSTLAGVFDFLDDTLFTSFDRRQMLAMSREIEDRAWRARRGRLYAGFQNAEAAEKQAEVYDRFARDTDIDIRMYLADELRHEPADGVEVVSGAGGEIGRFWFVIYDGAGDDMSKCGLIAEERSPGQFSGFWTYDPGTVDEVVDYLRSTYPVE